MSPRFHIFFMCILLLRQDSDPLLTNVEVKSNISNPDGDILCYEFVIY